MHSTPDLFYVANAANYRTKRSLFYPFKRRFLQKHGIPDGWDLQLVDRGDWGESRYYLQRYWLWGRIYHLPEYERPQTEPRNVIKGLIKHDVSICDRINPEQALFWLLLRNDPAALISHLFKTYTFNLRWRSRILKQKVKIKIKEWVLRDRQDDDCPF